jgi:hypothetical protein
MCAAAGGHYLPDVPIFGAKKSSRKRHTFSLAVGLGVVGRCARTTRGRALRQP